MHLAEVLIVVLLLHIRVFAVPTLDPVLVADEDVPKPLSWVRLRHYLSPVLVVLGSREVGYIGIFFSNFDISCIDFEILHLVRASPLRELAEDRAPCQLKIDGFEQITTLAQGGRVQVFFIRLLRAVDILFLLLPILNLILLFFRVIFILIFTITINKFEILQQGRLLRSDEHPAVVDFGFLGQVLVEVPRLETGDLLLDEPGSSVGTKCMVFLELLHLLVLLTVLIFQSYNLSEIILVYSQLHVLQEQDISVLIFELGHHIIEFAHRHLLARLMLRIYVEGFGVTDASDMIVDGKFNCNFDISLLFHFGFTQLFIRLGIFFHHIFGLALYIV